MKTYYAILAVEKEHEVELPGHRLPLPLTWADGMYGVMPVFKTKIAAKKYAGDTCKIMKIIIEEGKNG